MSVSRETEERFRTYLEMLTEWQTRMNLVAPSTLPEARTRHLEDSVQLIERLPPEQPVGTWVDLGSGAGFPGLVAAICMPDTYVHLIESREKKCTFLRAVSDAVGVAGRVTVHSARIESLKGPKADIISARACASLAKLFDWGLRFQSHSTLWILPKGRRAQSEIDEAREHFSFDLNILPSRTDPEGQILMVRTVKRLR